MKSHRPVLISGATGFLGGALARRLLAQGIPLRVITRNPSKAATLEALGAQVIRADLADETSLIQAVAGCAVVYHAAVDYTSWENQRRVNVEGTRHLVTVAARAQVERFVHISTIAAYGSGVRGDIYEDHPLIPGAYPYAITKAEAEQIIVDTAAHTGMAYTIIRPGMIYGPNAAQWTNFIFRLARRTPTLWLDDGRGSAHYIHVDDVVDLLVTAAVHPAAVNQAFHCSADPAPTWREVLSGFAQLAGHDLTLLSLRPLLTVIGGIAMLFSPPISLGRDLPDLLEMMSSRTTFKMTKAQERLGWSPRIALNEGIAGCAESLRQRGMLR